MNKLLFAISFTGLLFMFFSGCSNEASDPVTKQNCESNMDCPLGYYCNIGTGKCAKEGSDPEDNGDGLPGNENDDLPGENDDGEEENGGDTKDGSTCKCFGHSYTLPSKYADNPAWCMEDADGDGIANCIEAPNGALVDTDENGTPDYLDDDSDGDGIPDNYECPELLGEKDDKGEFVHIPYCRDSSSNGIPDYRDTDSDGDGIPGWHECPEFDEETGCRDSDEDGIPDYRDSDSDGDGIPDYYECSKFDPEKGCRDTDEDDIPDYLDLDSDGDGVPDSEECPALPCVDTDNNGTPDFIDLDSDGDGVPDYLESKCPDLGRDCRIFWDCNGNGYSDMVETAVGSDVCDPDKTPKDVGIDFYFELPWEGDEEDDTLIFSPTVKKADIMFNVDTTGSMGGEISKLKGSLSSYIIPQTDARISDSAFGVAQFRDENEVSLILLHPTTDDVAAQNTVNGLGASGGGDYPEAGYWSLYNIVNGASWRHGTMPIFIHITDATTHERGGVTRDMAVTALQSRGSKVITVFSGTDSTAINQLNDLSNSTGAVVPECAGAGRTTLRYSISSDGSGLDEATVNGIDALIKYATFSVYVEPQGDPAFTDFDTACFIKKVEALEYIGADTCAPQATPAEFNGVGYNNGFNNFSTGTSSATTPGSKLKFKVLAQNDNCFEPQEGSATSYKVYLNIVDAATGSILDTQLVTVIVPGKIDESGSQW